MRINAGNADFMLYQRLSALIRIFLKGKNRRKPPIAANDQSHKEMKYLIAGLGNIGPEYHQTRHNIGFMTLDALAQATGAIFKDGRYGFTTTLSLKGRQLLLLKPSTFMNLSGYAVRYWLQKENIPLDHLLVVVDDLALPFGTLRLKSKGGDAGHNGLKHIATTLGTEVYARLRFGIGNNFPRGGQIGYVLGCFTEEEQEMMEERLQTAGEMVKSFCLAGIDITMNQFNKKSMPPQSHTPENKQEQKEDSKQVPT